MSDRSWAQSFQITELSDDSNNYDFFEYIRFYELPESFDAFLIVYCLINIMIVYGG